jgi:hypothetical protein
LLIVDIESQASARLFNKQNKEGEGSRAMFNKSLLEVFYNILLNSLEFLYCLLI